MHCAAGYATDPIWRVLASSDGISSWTPLKPKHSNTNPNHSANQLWCIDFLSPPIPLIIPLKLPAFLESLMPLKNWCSIHARCSKSSLKHSIRFCGIFSKFKQNFIAYHSSKVSSRLHFALLDTRVLNSFEELCLIYIYIYIYICMWVGSNVHQLTHGKWLKEVYFSTYYPLWSIHFFRWCCSAWILLVKK